MTRWILLRQKNVLSPWMADRRHFCACKSTFLSPNVCKQSVKSGKIINGAQSRKTLASLNNFISTFRPQSIILTVLRQRQKIRGLILDEKSSLFKLFVTIFPKQSIFKMSKSYSNFMSKKGFHPGSYANQKKIVDAEIIAETKKKQEAEKLAQYQKEQELFHQKSLVSKQSKDKLSLNFMYDAPPGLKKSESDDKQHNEKVEWKTAGSSKSIKREEQKAPQNSICLEWKREKPVVKKKTPPIKEEPGESKERIKRIKKES